MAAVANGSRTRLDPAARRAQLVALGLQMLSTRPLDQVVIDEIASEAGISRGLLFHYFPTKRDFHVAVVRAAADDLCARTEPDPALPVHRRLLASLDAFVDYVSENRDAYIALLRGTAGGDPDLRAVLDDTRSVFTQRVLDGIDVPAPVPARLRIAVRGWVAFTEEATLDWLGADDLGRDQLIDLLDQALVNLVTMVTGQEASDPAR
jgi:AcrR family transcriptional regulator